VSPTLARNRSFPYRCPTMIRKAREPNISAGVKREGQRYSTLHRPNIPFGTRLASAFHAQQTFFMNLTGHLISGSGLPSLSHASLNAAQPILEPNR
jgi:hypothetical protein